MAHKGPIHKIAIMAMVVMLTLLAMPASVFAKMDGVVLKDSSGKLYKFDYAKLKTSLINDGPLYMKFQSLKNQGALVYSYHDDVQGKYVLRTDLINAFLDSTDESFNAQLATEMLQTTEMLSAVYIQLENSDGTISETKESSISFTVTTEYSSDLLGTKITVALENIALSDLSKYVVKYDGTEIELNSTTNTFDTFVNGNVDEATARSKVLVELKDSDTDFDVVDIQ